MNMPGFTADLSLYSSAFHYKTTTAQWAGAFALFADVTGAERYTPAATDMVSYRPELSANLDFALSQSGPVCPSGTACCEYDAESHRCIGGCCSRAGDCCPDGKPGVGNQCTNTSSDPANCGRCSNACGAGQSCSNGVCISCPAGLTACGGKCCPPGFCGSNGICCPLGELNCGGTCCPAGQCCGSSCCAAGKTCSSGLCCPPSQINCNGTCCSAASCCNGQCVQLLSNNNNCGSCGHKCPAGMGCSFGFCESVQRKCDNPVCDPNTGQCFTRCWTEIRGECTGLNGPRKCIMVPVGGAGLQCCDSSIFWGEVPWADIAFNDGSPGRAGCDLCL